MTLWICEGCGTDNEFDENTDISKVICDCCKEHPTEAHLRKAFIESKKNVIRNSVDLDLYYEEERKQIKHIIENTIIVLDQAQEMKIADEIIRAAIEEILDVSTKKEMDAAREEERKKEEQQRLEEEQRLERQKKRKKSIKRSIRAMAAAVVVLLFVLGYVALNKTDEYIALVAEGKTQEADITYQDFFERLPLGQDMFRSLVNLRMKKLVANYNYNTETKTEKEIIKVFDYLENESNSDTIVDLRQEWTELAESKGNYRRGYEAEQISDYESALKFYNKVIKKDTEYSAAEYGIQRSKDQYRRIVMEQIEDYAWAYDFESVENIVQNGLRVIPEDEVWNGMNKSYQYCGNPMLYVIAQKIMDVRSEWETISGVDVKKYGQYQYIVKLKEGDCCVIDIVGSQRVLEDCWPDEGDSVQASLKEKESDAECFDTIFEALIELEGGKIEDENVVSDREEKGSQAESAVTENFVTFDAEGFLFADSDRRYIDKNEFFSLAGNPDYSYQELLRFAVNEIYARRGYQFEAGGVYEQFYNQYEWYREVPKIGVDDSTFNEFEIANRNTILKIEEENGFR